jgi:hypothetical protein
VRDDPWDRPSLDLNVRPDKVVRDISRYDLRAPAGRGNLRLFAVCVACGVMFSLLFVWTTLTMAAILGLVSARWVYSVVVLVAIVSSVALFVFGSRDLKRWREWAERA